MCSYFDLTLPNSITNVNKYIFYNILQNKSCTFEFSQLIAISSRHHLYFLRNSYFGDIKQYESLTKHL